MGLIHTKYNEHVNEQLMNMMKGFPGGTSGKESACQCGDARTLVWSLGWQDPMEKEMATHCSILSWKIPCTQEPGMLQSMGLQRVGRNWESKKQQQNKMKIYSLICIFYIQLYLYKEKHTQCCFLLYTLVIPIVKLVIVTVKSSYYFILNIPISAKVEFDSQPTDTNLELWTATKNV